jgi:acyl-coenzyme A synthetase/AMP-(fatty) acid ligase
VVEVVGELPVNATGKVVKDTLRALAAADRSGGAPARVAAERDETPQA